jgi:acetone carboxylase gamma subunit
MNIIKLYDKDLWVDPNWYVGRKIECEHCGFTCELEEGDEENCPLLNVGTENCTQGEISAYAKFRCPTCNTIHTINP